MNGHSFELNKSWWNSFQPSFLPRRPTVRILIVVDGSISLSTTNDFGIGQLIQILRKEAPHQDSAEFSYAAFSVQTATRDAAPVAGSANYTNFRFDQVVGGAPILNRFDQVWLFGFHPGNSGDPDDAPIEAHGTRLTPAELTALTRWMDERDGGVLAMGDHHFLGATMCWKIPRVRAMRRWTNADGVPPIDTPISSAGGPVRYRHDTNQPQNEAQRALPNPATIPFSAQADLVPQPIQLKMYGSVIRRRPHALLCDRVYGPIDVLPDHPHEGWVYDDADAPTRLTHNYVDRVPRPDFPDADDGGARPLPEAIAWARPWTEPPYEHQKSPTPVRRFPVIGVYDGHRAGVGRVVVDSTWHHWMDVNINQLIQASASGAATPAQAESWHKIKTYFRNCAVWLSPPKKQLAMLSWAAFWSVGTGVSQEEYHAGVPSWSLGETARDILGQLVSPCILQSWIRPLLPRLIPELELPGPSPCLTCPPVESLEDAVLGGLIKELIPERDRLIEAKISGRESRADFGVIAAAAQAGARRGLEELAGAYVASLARTQDLVKRLTEPVKTRDVAAVARELEDSGEEPTPARPAK